MKLTLLGIWGPFPIGGGGCSSYLVEDGDTKILLDCGSGAEVTCPSEKVKVASTVGAGDSFGAAFLHKLFAGGDLKACLQYAGKVAAFVVSRNPAVPEYDPKKLA